jgi:hypothetical protein
MRVTPPSPTNRAPPVFPRRRNSGKHSPTTSMPRVTLRVTLRSPPTGPHNPEGLSEIVAVLDPVCPHSAQWWLRPL